MEFVFVCPENQAVFRTRNFDITENKGVQKDANGDRFLDARIALKDPCPFCGRMHTYHAGELTCPFENPDF